MQIPLVQASWDGYRLDSLEPDAVLDIRPAPGWPRGRKGALMAEAWETWRGKGAPGVIWMDPDIVADPHDLAALQTCASRRPAAVWCSLHKLWPASTGRDTWVWGHGPWEGDRPGMGTESVDMPGWFAMGMTYTPAALLEDAKHELPTWPYGAIDMGLSAAARELEIPIRVALRCQPKHLHFRPRRGDLGWREGA